MNRIVTVCVIGLLCCALVPGCGQGGGERKYTVSGTVTLNNEPVAEAAVTFLPAGGGPPEVAKTDATGRFTISAVPGRYKVTIAKYVSEEQPAAAGGGEYQEVSPDVTPAPARNVLPAKYADPSTSGFEVEVKAGENNFTFNLEGG